MKLYLISQTANLEYDTYDAAVVAAPDEEIARKIKPSDSEDYPEWTTPDNVRVQLIGTALKGTQQGVILASFRAG